MGQPQTHLIECNISVSDTTEADIENTLILLKPETRKNVDQTISTPDRYVSWYHYNTRNIAKHLELCPHCKKPIHSAFDRAVIDSAIDYLNGKRMLKRNKFSGGGFLANMFMMAAISIAAYFVLSRI